MLFATYFSEHVLPRLPEEQVLAFFGRFPDIQLEPEMGFSPLKHLPVLMLVALTGTGKTTTLRTLSAQYGDLFDATRLPSRREVADFFVIPTAQILANEPIQAVADRVDRFRLTRLFAEYFDGGIAAVYASLYCRNSERPLVSEGIRGANEITYALDHCSAWRVLELSVHPVTRLQRLSSRKDAFDQVFGTVDVSFLPVELQDRVITAYQQGEISPAALTIVQAEARNYGLWAVQAEHPNCFCLQTDDLFPEDVATKIAGVLEGMTRYANY